jgi:hypothetical protein
MSSTATALIQGIQQTITTSSYTLTTLPHMRDPSINDIAFYTTLKLRAKGLAVSLAGTTGI